MRARLHTSSGAGGSPACRRHKRRPGSRQAEGGRAGHAPTPSANAAAGSRAQAKSTGNETPAKITARTASYVTRPTRFTLFLRTFIPWQLWRFARINQKMMRIIRHPHT
jgi:hypothetical protein